MPTPYTMKFIIMVWLAFLARHRPVSTIANPACMNMTRKPVTSVQTKLIAILFWPTWLAMSPIVRPFALGVLSVMGSAIGNVRNVAGQAAVRIAVGAGFRVGRRDTP